MAKKNSYSVYGDDEQELFNQLVSKEKEVITLVDQATTKTLKKRAQLLKKHKKIKDTSLNRRVQNEELSDLDENQILESQTVNDLEDVETAVVENVANEEESKETKKPEKKKKKKKGKAFKVIIGFLLLLVVVALGIIGYPYALEFIRSWNKPVDPVIETTSIPSEAPIETVVPSVDSVVEVDEIKGMLPLFDQNRAYTLQDTLTLANIMNQSISSYYEQTLSLITDYVESDGSVSIEGEISNLGAMANKDRNELSKYVGVFSAYSGDLFINSTIDRFDNLINLYGNVFDEVEPTQLAKTVNGYIDIENQISVESKDDLITYLTTNNIDYVDNGDYVSFSTQDVEEADAENTEATVDEEALKETSNTDENKVPENAANTEDPVESNPTESVEPTASIEAE